jgi:hypothetical protein
VRGPCRQRTQERTEQAQDALPPRYAQRLRDGYGPRQNVLGAKMRRIGDGWLETAADDAAMAIQLAQLFVIRDVHYTLSNRHLHPFEHCLVRP